MKSEVRIWTRNHSSKSLFHSISLEDEQSLETNNDWKYWKFESHKSLLDPFSVDTYIGQVDIRVSSERNIPWELTVQIAVEFTEPGGKPRERHTQYLCT